MPALTAAPAMRNGCTASNAAIFSLPPAVSGFTAEGASGIVALLVSCFGLLVGCCAWPEIAQQSTATTMMSLIRSLFWKIKQEDPVKDRLYVSCWLLQAF